jgi:lysophospholipase L1-like esterase
MGPLNIILGTHGYPDCIPGPKGVSGDLEANQLNMECAQRKGAATALKVACIGDSITAGAHASSGAMAYPGQLQSMVDSSKYSITNLGACGSTMQKAPNADSPYWSRPQYQALIAGKWDIVVIMLGTNDAKDPIDGGPNNWRASCTHAQKGFRRRIALHVPRPPPPPPPAQTAAPTSATSAHRAPLWRTTFR